MSFQQIYNLLLAGKKLVLKFDEAQLAENFRTRMAHHKAKQEKTLEGLGVAVEDERTQFSFKVQKPEEQSAEVVAFLQFASPSPLRRYPVVILEESDLAPQV
jgi:hypothetical protein